MSDDLIRREDAIKAVNKALKAVFVDKRMGESIIGHIPSADRPSVDKEYLTKLIQESVYDGEACARLLDLVDRPQGEWIDAEIPLECGGSMPIQVCNLCKTFYPLAYTGGGHRFCPNCGARMKGADDE